MQIDRLNHLQFPPGSAPAPAAKESAPDAKGAVQARPRPPTLVDRTERPTPSVPSVVLRIQADTAQALDAAQVASPVYSDQRNNAVSPSEESDTDQMARVHQSALDRSAGVLTRMSVDKDGVLVVSKPATAAAKPIDFVSVAVSAMRVFADEAERLNSQSAAGKLQGLQQLAARFKVFA